MKKAYLLIFFVYLLFSNSLDILVASWFLNGHHTYQAPKWCVFVYNYGLLPGQILFFGSIATTIFALCLKRMSLAAYGLYLSLTLVIGSGCIGHCVGKQFWPRPRPKQTVLFGGSLPFHPLFQPCTHQTTKRLRSLPCGHATMGFYFFSLYFLGKRIEKKWLMWWGIFLAFFLGTLLSWARMAQGGHFLSDNIVSLLIMAGTAYVLDTYTSRITEFLNQYR